MDRTIRMFVSATIAVTLFVWADKALANDPVVLVRDGQPAATIVVADKPLWKNVTAGDAMSKDGRIDPRVFAEELQFWIERATGAKLPIVAAADCPKEGTLVVFGESAVSKRFGFDCRTMPPEGYRIVTFDRGVALLGDVFPALERGGYFANREKKDYPDPEPVEGDLIDRSIGHATYDFLEQFVGYRFYHGADRSDEEQIAFGTITPEVKTLTIPAETDVKRHPDFLHRAGVVGDWNAPDPLMWQRCFRKGGSADIQANHSHTSWHSVYGKTHPEIFALNKDGVPYFKDPSVRPPFRSALNYAHPKTLELEIEHIEYFDRTHKLHNGWRAYATPNRLLPTPADGKWYDYSPEAAKLSFPDADMYRSQSDVYWSYIAKLARIAKERWPERMVVGSAYNRRMCPPTDRVSLPDNVCAQMALCRSSAMTTQPVYREWLNAQIDRWHELLGRDRRRFGTWDYICWPHGHFMAPVIHPHRLQEFLKRNHDKIAGQFVNPGGHDKTDHIMIVLWHKLLWDVDADVDALIDEHCRLFYGPAGEHVAALNKLAAERYESTIWTDTLGVSSIPGSAFFGKIYPKEVVERMKTLFDRAFGAVAEGDDNAIYRKRLHYIYDAPDTEHYYSQDGWEAFFRTADNYFAEPVKLTAPRGGGKVDWSKVGGATLMRGTHVCTAKKAKSGNEATVRFATDGKTLHARVECGANEALAERIFDDGVVLKFYDVPGARVQPDADIRDEGFFMPPQNTNKKQSVLSIAIDSDGTANYKDVAVDIRRGGTAWVADVAIPYTLLGIEQGKPRRLLVDARRLVSLKSFKPGRRRWQKRQRERIEYGLALKEGFVWQAFDPARRGVRLFVK